MGTERVWGRQNGHRAKLKRCESPDHPCDGSAHAQAGDGERCHAEGTHDADHVESHLSQVAVPAREVGGTEAS